MIVQALTFYLFAGIVLASGVMVISSKNPVHSVLFLILAFFNAAGLFVLLGAEFLAMLLVVVYVGAVAVLFLFVVMMLDINYAELRQGFLQYLPMGGLVGLILLIEILAIVGGWHFGADAANAVQVLAPEAGSEITNTQALGLVLYTDYLYLFQAAGLVLLVAMVGAIVLTHRKRPGVLSQRVPDQIARRAEESAKTIKMTTGEGI